MAWLFGSFQSNDSESSHQTQTQAPAPAPEHSPRGRDLSAIRRQVAAFLAPPPPSNATVSSQVLVGIRNDLAEIGGSFRTGLSLLSSNKAVIEISRFASTFSLFQHGDDHRRERVPRDDGGEIDGEVLAFVKEISALPACWTDFPLALDNDFHMSDGQREHALAIEHLVPRLGVLRVKLRGYISDEQFWMIYFILLLPRLNGHDIELLSTPKIVQARDALLQKLENRSYGKSKIPDASQDSETRVERVAASEVAKGTNSEDATGQWLEDIDDTNASLVVLTHKHEDVSFTDLEDDDSDHPGRSSSIDLTQETWSSSPTGSSDWVQLKNESRGSQKTGRAISRGRESESDGSNGWLTVDDFD